MTIFLPPDLPRDLTPYPAPLKRLSAGRAWLFSMLLPGAGQLYCGAMTRGYAMLFVVVVGAGAAFSFPRVVETFARVAVMFYALAPLDAYRTAREHNAGVDVDAPFNPRVAALLNLTTNGFGYLYVGIRHAIGYVLVLIVVLRVLSQSYQILAELVMLAIAVHAWRIAQRKRDESYPPERYCAEESSFPSGVPTTVAAIILGHWWLLLIVGTFAAE